MSRFEPDGPKLTAMLHKLRAQETALFESQNRCLKAIDVAWDIIRSDERVAKDQRYVEIMAIFDKAVEGAVKTGMP